MSILLDALRKSEQQKKLGATPDIHSMEPVTYTPGRPAWLVPGAMTLLVLALLAGSFVAWRVYFQHPPDSADTVLAAPAAAVTGPESALAASDGERSGSSETASGALLHSAPRLDQQPRSPVESLTGSSPYQPARQAARDPDPDPPAAASVDMAQASSVASRPGPGAAQPVSDDNASRPAVQPARKEPATEARAAINTPPPRPANQSSADNGVISYWQLPESARQQIPPIKITVLVYDELPSNRFILVGGKRYKVGDMLGNDVRLLNIQREQAVFRHGAYRFFVTQR